MILLTMNPLTKLIFGLTEEEEEQAPLELDIDALESVLYHENEIPICEPSKNNDG